MKHVWCAILLLWIALAAAPSRGQSSPSDEGSRVRTYVINGNTPDDERKRLASIWPPHLPSEPALRARGQLVPVMAQSADGASGKQTMMLRVTNDGAAPLTFPVGSFSGSEIQNPTFKIVGEVACRDVQGQAYMEMWVEYGEGKRYFSRSLAESGRSQYLTGTQAKREFMLPFDTQGQGQPRRVAVNVVLPGAGTVDIYGVALAQALQSYVAAESVAAARAQEHRATWARISIIIALLIGVPFGLIGLALIITFSVLLATGRKRAAMTLLLIMGIVLAAISLPSVVLISPLLAGPFLLLAIAMIVLAAIGRRNAPAPEDSARGTATPPKTKPSDAELRKMQAMDV